MECLVRNNNQKNLENYLQFVLAVYEETNTIWFSDFYDEEEEAMYKLIGVRT
jgi:hypothetical protein